MGLLDKAEELEEKTEIEEEEDIYTEAPKKKGKKKKKGGKKKDKKSSSKKKKLKGRKKKAAVEEEDDEEEDYYGDAPPKKKKAAKKKKAVKAKEAPSKKKKKGAVKRIDPRTLPYAPLWKRFAATAIDYVFIAVVISMILVFVVQDIIKDDRKLAPAYWVGVCAIVSFVYFFLFDAILGGRSIGKYIFGTEIINQYGNKPKFFEGLLSAFGKILFPLLIPAIPLFDMTGLFFGRSSRFYQRRFEHKMHLFVVDHAKYHGLDKMFEEEGDYFSGLDDLDDEDDEGGDESSPESNEEQK